MRMRGTLLCLRMSLAISKVFLSVMPFLSAVSELSWIVGPSAIGSEKGIPSSKRSAPALASATTSGTVFSTRGKPAVTNRERALCLLRFSLSDSVILDLINGINLLLGDQVHD